VRTGLYLSMELTVLIRFQIFAFREAGENRIEKAEEACQKVNLVT